MRKKSATRRTAARRFASVMAAAGALLVSSGIALMAAPAPAAAGDNSGNGIEKPWICHAVEGKGETKTGYNIIDPADASSHIDEALYPSGTYWKHESKDGTRHDKYATLTDDTWTCQGPEVRDLEAYADVQWIDPACGTKADLKLKSGDPVDVTWSEPSPAPAPGVTVSITATAMDGYTFDGSPTKTFSHPYPQVVAPEGQTYDPATGLCTTVSPPVTPPAAPTPPQVSPPKAPVKAHVKAKAETTTPTVVHAGLAGSTVDTSTQAGLALTAAGLALLAGAAGLVVVEGTRRK